MHIRHCPRLLPVQILQVAKQEVSRRLNRGYWVISMGRLYGSCWDLQSQPSTSSMPSHRQCSRSNSSGCARLRTRCMTHRRAVHTGDSCHLSIPYSCSSNSRHSCPGCCLGYCIQGSNRQANYISCTGYHSLLRKLGGERYEIHTGYSYA